MAKLHIIYDPDEIVTLGTTERDHHYVKRTGILHAQMPIAEHIESHDIYVLARKLAELLLEQLA